MERTVSFLEEINLKKTRELTAHEAVDAKIGSMEINID
jgi:hypothetical protein